MRTDHFDKLASAKAALLSAEAAHPGSNALAVLHARASAVVEAFAPLLTDDQYQTLAGGTNKDDGTSGSG